MAKDHHNHKAGINIDALSMDDLLELNKRVVSRLKEINAQEQAEAASRFRIGDMVSFAKTGDNAKVTGFILSIRKTKISILTEDNEQYTVSPTLLSPEEAPSKKLLKLVEEIFPKTVRAGFSVRK